MATPNQSDKRLLLISDGTDRAAALTRVLRELGYDVGVCASATALVQCGGTPPAAIVVSSVEQAADVQDALREIRQWQQEGRLSAFPIVAAGQPEGDASWDLVDGVVLEPDRLTSLATEISKQVDGIPTPAPLPAEVEEEAEGDKD